MQRLDSVFTEPMKNSLIQNQPFLVKNLTGVADIMDYLIAAKVFPDSEDVMCINNRKDQVRKLLSRLVTRPARHYWAFVSCLYEDRMDQGNIAEVILSTFEEEGGKISPEVSRLRQDYVDRQRQHDNIPPVAHPPDPPVPPHHQRLPTGQAAAPGEFSLFVPSTSAAAESSGFSHRTERGNLVTTESASMIAQQASQPEMMEVDAGDGRRQNASQPPAGPSGAGGETVYSRARRTNQNKVYAMDSNPRGLALIIENENFDSLPIRTGTKDDQEQLEDLLRNDLGFEVIVKRDLSAQEMQTSLRDFAEDPRMAEVDSCIVAILSHGSAGGVIYGVNGKVEGELPVEETFILTTEMRSFFTSTRCRLAKKPKLFILQACRGDLEDTAQGVMPVRRDVAREAPLPPRTESVYSDMATVYATLEDMVGYRNTFIPPLVKVFRDNAATLCFKEMMTELHGEVCTTRIGDDLYVSPECSDNLRKKWYFNPPSDSA